MKFLIALGLVAAAANGAWAAPLTLSVTGDPGSNQVTMTFGGSQVASAAGVFGAPASTGNPVTESQFLDVGYFTATPFDTALFGVASGLATFSVFDGTSTLSQDFAAVMIDSDFGNADDIGFSFGGPALAFSAGDTVSLSGSVVVTGLDFNQLLAGTYTTQPSASFDPLNDGLDLELTIGPAAVVPLPATLPLLAGALGLLALVRRRRGGTA